MLQKVLFSFIGLLLLMNTVLATSFSREDLELKKIQKKESTYFDKKDEEFWILQSKEAFKEASILIDDKGSWLGKGSAPHYIKFVHKLQREDLPVLLKWLTLKELECFSIADESRQPNLELILDVYSDLKKQGKIGDPEQQNLYKLAWLDYKTMLHELDRGAAATFPAEWLETNRAFQMKNSHYTEIETH